MLDDREPVMQQICVTISTEFTLEGMHRRALKSIFSFGKKQEDD